MYYIYNHYKMASWVRPFSFFVDQHPLSMRMVEFFPFVWIFIPFKNQEAPKISVSAGLPLTWMIQRKGCYLILIHRKGRIFILAIKKVYLSGEAFLRP